MSIPLKYRTFLSSIKQVYELGHYIEILEPMDKRDEYIQKLKTVLSIYK